MEFLGGGGGGAAHVAVSLGVPQPLEPLPALPPGHQMCHASSCALAVFLAVSLFVTPALVLAAVELSRAYLLLFLGQLLIALSALEWSWLWFRIRRKLLFTLKVQGDLPEEEEQQQQQLLEGGNDGESAAEQGQNQEQEYEEDHEETGNRTETTLFMRRQWEMRASQFAVSSLADRYCGGRWYVVAFLIAMCGAGVALAGVYVMERDVFEDSKSALGRDMLVATTTVGMFLAVFLGCLAPSKLDALVLAMYMGCFVASSMNTFLMYYANSIGATELLDSLFVLLVGACGIFLLRVVSSKFVMESLLLVLGDILGLIMIVAPMIMAADFVDHPGAVKNRDKLALFFLVMFASEIGRWVTKMLKTRSPQTLPLLQRCCCRRHRDEIDHTMKNEATSSTAVEELLGAIALGALMLPVSLIGGSNQSLTVVEAVMLIAAMTLGQWSRFLMASVKQMAEVTTTGFYLPEGSSVGGVLDRTAVFTVGVFIFHTYLKYVYYR